MVGAAAVVVVAVVVAELRGTTVLYRRFHFDIVGRADTHGGTYNRVELLQTLPLLSQRLLTILAALYSKQR